MASRSLHSAGEVLHSSVGLRGAPHAALHMCGAPRRAPRTMAARGTRGGQRSARWFRARAHANAVCRSGGPGSGFAFASTVFATVLTVASRRRPHRAGHTGERRPRAPPAAPPRARRGAIKALVALAGPFSLLV